MALCARVRAELAWWNVLIWAAAAVFLWASDGIVLHGMQKVRGSNPLAPPTSTGLPSRLR